MPDFPLPDEEDEDEGEDVIHALPVPSGDWPLVKSLWVHKGDVSMGHGVRGGISVANTVGGIASGVASHAGTGGIAAHVGLGAAATALTVGTGGIAVAAAAGALQIGSMIASARSFSSTWDHLDRLKAIQMRSSWPCKPLGAVSANMSGDHNHIHDCVIPYIINKKVSKLVKKGAGAVGLGAGTSLFGLGKNLYKRIRGTLGRRRTFYAEVIARHMITHDCKLCEALVTDLYSSEADYRGMLILDSKKAGEYIAAKMKSK